MASRPAALTSAGAAAALPLLPPAAGLGHALLADWLIALLAASERELAAALAATAEAQLAHRVASSASAAEAGAFEHQLWSLDYDVENVGGACATRCCGVACHSATHARKRLHAASAFKLCTEASCTGPVA